MSYVFRRCSIETTAPIQFVLFIDIVFVNNDMRITSNVCDLLQQYLYAYKFSRNDL